MHLPPSSTTQILHPRHLHWPFNICAIIPFYGTSPDEGAVGVASLLRCEWRVEGLILRGVELSSSMACMMLDRIGVVAFICFAEPVAVVDNTPIYQRSYMHEACDLNQRMLP